MATDPVDLGMLLQGDIFTFFIGPEKTTFSLHANAVSKQSEVLDRLMNGSMKEAVNGTAELSDIDVDTFMRFASFCYTEDYRGLNSKAMSQAQKDVVSPVGTDNWFCLHCKSLVENDRSGKDYPFCSRTCSMAGAKNRSCSKWQCGVEGPQGDLLLCNACEYSRSQSKKGRKNRYSQNPPVEPKAFQVLRTENVPFSMLQTDEVVVNPSMTPEELLCHAKLVVFADRYHVVKLKTMGLVALAIDMAQYPVNSDTAASVIRLLKYTYENSSGGSVLGDGTEDVLRKVVTGFAAEHIRVLMGSVECWKMLEDGGELAVDLFRTSMK